MPDPFDYERGIAQFEGVGKFGALRGVDVGAALRAGLRGGGHVRQRRRRLHCWGSGPPAPRAARRASPASRSAPASARAGSSTARSSIRAAARAGGSTAWTSPGARSRTCSRGARSAGPSPRPAATPTPTCARSPSRPAPGRGRRAGCWTRRRSRSAGWSGACLAGFRADVLVVGGSMAASWDLFAPAVPGRRARRRPAADQARRRLGRGAAGRRRPARAASGRPLTPPSSAHGRGRVTRRSSPTASRPRPRCAG